MHTNQKYDYPSHPYFEAFRASIKSKVTRKVWTIYLHNYMAYHKMQGYHELVGDEGSPNNSKLIQTRLIQFINYKRDQGIRAQTIGGQLTALRKFYWINEIDGIKWDRVRAYLGEPTKAVDDKAYTHEQIAQALRFMDYRQKVIVFAQASTAMRIGGVAGLKWGDLEFIERHGIYSFKVYKGTPAEYLTFCTPECAAAIDAYMNYRRQSGETITANSPLIRDQFSADNANKPRTPSLESIHRILRNGFVKAGLRTIEKGGSAKNRKENMLTHALRKFARKQMRKAGMDPIIAEYLLGHMSGDMKVGVSKLMMTYDPSEDSELLSEYLKAIDNLTISNEARERRKTVMLEQDIKTLKEQVLTEVKAEARRDLDARMAAYMKEQYPDESKEPQ